MLTSRFLDIGSMSGYVDNLGLAGDATARSRSATGPSSITSAWGRARNGTRIVLLVAGRHIRIIDRNGELLRDFELDPSRDYQPRSLG